MKQAGLVVTVKPSASAYFAGEQFTATITFTNSHPAAARDRTTEPPPPPYPSHSRSASTASLSRSLSKNGTALRSRPPNASHLGLAEYATDHLDSDEVPPSPFFGSTSGQFQALPDSPNGRYAASNSPKRPSFGSSLSHAPSSRSFSNHSSSNPVASTSTAAAPIPIRKGLVGKPPAPEPTNLLSKVAAGGGGGLYAGGPRRPGGLLRTSHGRTQSLAVNSSPDLLATSTSSDSIESYRSASAGHRKQKFGGSVAGFHAHGIDESRRTSGTAPLASTLLEEEDHESSSPVESTTPSYHEDAAFPIHSSSSSPAPPAFPRRPTFGHQRIPSSHFYQNTRAGLSTLSLADSDSDNSDYDPNDDSMNQSLPANGFYGVGRNDTMDSVVEGSLNASYGPNGKNGNPTPSNTNGRGGLSRDSFEGSSKLNGSRTAVQHHDHHPPHTIALLWAFAHLEGSFEVDEDLIKEREFLEVKQLLAGGVGGVGMGGGTLEPKKQETGGWKNWLWGNSNVPPAQDPSRRGDNLKEGDYGTTNASGEMEGAATLEERKEKAVKDKSVPIFSCPPSILGVDLVLEPGESKCFSFSIRLPADLPPSFRGKAIKFNYQLIVGSNRVSIGNQSGNLTSRKGSVSRVMRVPLRIYNHVGVTGARPFYDLTNPVIYQRDEATVTAIEDETKLPPARRKAVASDVGRAEFESFAANLLSSIAISPELSHRPFPQLSASIGGGNRGPGSMKSIMDVKPEMRPEMSSHRGGGGPEAFGIDLDEANGCKTAVEIVSRNAQKVSYDINKDGYLVAQLTLVKSAYRLGETVNGSVVINSGEGRVLRVSARLETHELVETSISTKPAPQTRQATRRLHSEHHDMTLDSARLGFALAIPSGATPDFGTSGVKLQWSVRLSFLVIPPSPDAPTENPNLTPRRGLPNSIAPPNSAANGRPGAGHGRSKSFAYGFEPAVPLTLPAAPSIAPTGAAHLMPISTPSPVSSFEPAKAAQYTSYRAVPDLGFVPVLFSSSLPEPPPPPGPLQKTAAGAMHRPHAPSMSLSSSQRGDPLGGARTVLVPAKVETVECSIPIKVYPGNTPFRPTVTSFSA
ncbi:Rgp1p [Sporobolomyces koalae]|uniref:Rgp1p n=1 Tax=Sporobolomyces koalae TaxID=500713 RepID=UPI00317C8BB7